MGMTAFSRKIGFGLMLVAAGMLAPCAARAIRFDFAPAAEALAPPVDKEKSDVRALGPLIERRISVDGSAVQSALPRPLWTRYEVPGKKLIYNDFLWPLAFSRSRPDGDYQYVVLFLHSSEPGLDNKRMWLLPILFYGHQAPRNKAYFALFPVGGRMGDWLGFDTVDFVLFPIWVRSRKSDMETTTWLWPIFSHTKGERVEKRRVFPFYGMTQDAREKRSFYVWPFGYGIDQFKDAKGREGHGWFVLPFYGQYKRTDADGKVLHSAWTCLWPFFSGESGPERDRLYAPWPFYRHDTGDAPEYAGGEKIDKLNLWPVYGRETKEKRRSGYTLWPFWQWGEAESEDMTKSFTTLVPFWWSASSRKGEAELMAFRELWPLWRLEREDGRSRASVLSLWPQRRAECIQRNYAPLWTLYTRDTDPAGIRHDVFWGLAKWHRTAASGDTRRASLFPVFEYESRPLAPTVDGKAEGWSFDLVKGLVGWGRDGDRRRLRLLWIPLDAGAAGK